MRKKAFTLIELLVTIVLFSLLLGTALYSFRFISINMRNINNTNPKTAIYYDLLRNTINSIYFYVEMDEKEKNINKKFYHYFQGKKNECFFVSSSAFFSRRLSIVHIIYKENALWYEEGEIFGKKHDYINLKNISLDKKVLLIDNVKSVSFSYFYDKKEYQELFRNIPFLITIKIEEQFKTKVYIFSTKSDNYKHLQQVSSREFL